MTLSQNVSWNEIESLVEKLSESILELSRSFSSITTLSRGGLVPSRLLADALGIKTILVDQKTISSDSLLWMIFLTVVKHFITHFLMLMILQNLYLQLFMLDVE